jgi:hypothetical protein
MKGGMFNYVSGANFLGEIIEWAGFAVAGWSPPSAAFAISTVCSIGTRAVHHHRFYFALLSQFDNFTKCLANGCK